jgi:hypothetical protein
MNGEAIILASAVPLDQLPHRDSLGSGASTINAAKIGRTLRFSQLACVVGATTSAAATNAVSRGNIALPKQCDADLNLHFPD